MKAFEKWWKKSYGGIYGKNGSKTAWAAALEWMMRTGIDHYGDDFSCYDLCKDIRHELGQSDTTPPESRNDEGCDNCAVSPNDCLYKVRLLAHYLAKFLATGIDRLHKKGLPMDFSEEGLKPILEQALDAYQSTENVTIKIERNE